MKLLTCTTFLAITPLLTLAAPTNITTNLHARADDWSFQTCSKTSPGWCTVYIATSDPDVSDYRTAGLFDHNCNILQAVRGTKTTRKLTLRGNLDYFVDIFVDESAQPSGWISYLGKDVPLGSYDTLGNQMACFKPPHSDGTGCRKAFSCS